MNPFALRACRIFNWGANLKESKFGAVARGLGRGGGKAAKDTETAATPNATPSEKAPQGKAETMIGYDFFLRQAYRCAVGDPKEKQHVKVHKLDGSAETDFVAATFPPHTFKGGEAPEQTCTIPDLTVKEWEANQQAEEDVKKGPVWSKRCEVESVEIVVEIRRTLDKTDGEKFQLFKLPIVDGTAKTKRRSQLGQLLCKHMPADDPEEQTQQAKTRMQRIAELFTEGKLDADGIKEHLADAKKRKSDTPHDEPAQPKKNKTEEKATEATEATAEPKTAPQKKEDPGTKAAAKAAKAASPAKAKAAPAPSAVAAPAPSATPASDSDTDDWLMHVS